MKSLTFTTAFIIGGVIGATAVALTSPISGKCRRQRINCFLTQTTEDIDDVTQNLQRVRHSLDHLAKTANETIPTFKKDMEHIVSDFKFQAEPRINAINDSVQKLQNDLDIESN